MSYAKPPSAKSSHWNKFQDILVNNLRQRFISCNHCHLISTWTALGETNVMKQHSNGFSKAKEPSPQIQPRIISWFKEPFLVILGQLRFHKNETLYGPVEMCVLDSPAFNIAHGKDFEEFTKRISDATKHFGEMLDAKHLLIFTVFFRLCRLPWYYVLFLYCKILLLR